MNEKNSNYRRLNITIGDAQYQALTEQGINISGLVRDLLGDHLSEHCITLQVTESTRRLYDTIIANTGATDASIEKHLRAALAAVLDQEIESMRALRRQLDADQTNES